MSPENPIVAKLVPLAAAARDKGEHYADFKVGCIGYYADDDGNVCVIEGANTKLTPLEEKHCAEKKVLRVADRSDIMLDGLIVFGLPRKEDVAPTLHPCEACRKLLWYYVKQGRAIQLTTQIICVNAHNGEIEHFTVAELLAAHRESLEDD